MSSIPWQSPKPLKIKSFGTLLTAKAQRWARKRQGIDKPVTELQSRRIYILPTGVGLVFALMTFAMLLGSMNYNNNLSFVLTFMLVGLGLVAMHQCQRNLVGLEVRFAGVDPVYAGQLADFRVAVTNRYTRSPGTPCQRGTSYALGFAPKSLAPPARLERATPGLGKRRDHKK
jgi:hypothetical protein